MPLSGSAPVLSASLRAAFLAEDSIGMQDNAALTKFCDVIATVVLAHFTANAELVTSCPAGAGTGTVT